jgi:hemerythrin superfamily protein
LLEENLDILDTTEAHDHLHQLAKVLKDHIETKEKIIYPEFKKIVSEEEADKLLEKIEFHDFLH